MSALKYLIVKTQTGKLTLWPMFYFQLSNFNFALPWSFKKVYSTHRMFRVGGSILAGVFLASSICVVPECLYSSNAASSTFLEKRWLTSNRPKLLLSIE